MLCTYHRGVRDLIEDPTRPSSTLASARPCIGDEPFAVVDVEATGPDPHDARVIEVGVVLLDRHGQFEGGFESLVNPRVDFGDNVHGLHPADVASAPTFDAIAAEVGRCLEGRVLVAHEASYEMAILRRELGERWYHLDPVALCTRENLGALGVRSRSLVDVCHELGIDHPRPHRAMWDARATAELMRRYLTSARFDGHSLLVPHGGCKV